MARKGKRNQVNMTPMFPKDVYLCRDEDGQGDLCIFESLEGMRRSGVFSENGGYIGIYSLYVVKQEVVLRNYVPCKNPQVTRN